MMGIELGVPTCEACLLSLFWADFWDMFWLPWLILGFPHSLPDLLASNPPASFRHAPLRSLALASNAIRPRESSWDRRADFAFRGLSSIPKIAELPQRPLKLVQKLKS